MTGTQLLRWHVAMHMLTIWDPKRWDSVAGLSAQRRRQMQLKYRANGVVTHDRALNGEKVR